MRAKCPPCFIFAIAVIALGSFATDALAERPPRPGELEPVVDPSAAVFAVTGAFLPGPVDPPLDAPTVPTPPTAAPPVFHATPALGETGAFDPVGSLGGAILSARSAGPGVTGMQQAKRSLKQLIRELG